jgi:16S rRNA C967 or C1407 C5-methylase (RsmB/RsmF family)/NOL1/NOP2/fmu family ribosome biogenesis protein
LEQSQILQLLAQHLPTEEQSEFILAHQNSPSLSIRWNLNKQKSLDLNKFVPWAKGAEYLEERPIFALDPLWHSGAYYVQEASSMLLYQALIQNIKSDQPLRVLDLCAAPGGKTTLTADVLPKNSLLIANEVIKNRATILAENVQKWGNCDVWVSNNDPKHFAKLEQYFDIILIDAPCSGSGLLRKDVNAHQEWSDDNVALCAQRQERIIHDIAPSLKPDGLLIYMTCSYSEIENQGIATKIIEDLDFESVPLQLSENWMFTSIKVKNQVVGYQSYPHKVKGEGFFLSCFKNTTPANQSSNNNKQKTPKKFKLAKAEVPTNFLNAEGLAFFEDNQQRVFALNQEHLIDYEELTTALYFIRKGIFCGSWAKNDFIPEHDLAMSTLNIYNRKVDLNLKQALAFLRRQNFEVELEEKGWFLCTYKKVPLGWLKNIGNRFNNYFPTHIRLRMS